MSFIVIEGLDGSGKSTQVKMLQQFLVDNNIKFKYLHFPRTESPVFGELVSMFLRGDLGNLESVNPYLVALIYAGDRDNAKQIINDWISEKYLVLVDRYVYSNIAFQCAKNSNEDEKKKLANWILSMEYDFFKIPKPDLSLFLDVPFEFTKKQLSTIREGDDRDYLKGKQDIHEADLNFQEKVRQVYLKYSKQDSSFVTIHCYNEQHEMKKPDVIFNELISCLRQNKII